MSLYTHTHLGGGGGSAGMEHCQCCHFTSGPVYPSPPCTTPCPPHASPPPLPVQNHVPLPHLASPPRTTAGSQEQGGGKFARSASHRHPAAHNIPHSLPPSSCLPAVVRAGHWWQQQRVGARWWRGEHYSRNHPPIPPLFPATSPSLPTIVGGGRRSSGSFALSVHNASGPHS